MSVTIGDVLREVRDASFAVDERLASRYEWSVPVSASPAAAPTRKLPDGFFLLADFLCERVHVPVGSAVDFLGFKFALAGRRPKPEHMLLPEKPKSNTRRYSREDRNKAVPHRKRAA